MDSSACPICQYEIDFYAIGVCNHPICLRCAIKLRRFGGSEDANRSCPTCRTKNASNRVSTTLKSWDEFAVAKLIKEPELNLEFEDNAIEKAYKKLTSCICPICAEIRPTLGALNMHTTNNHGLSYCDLCLRYAHMLPCEFKLMTKDELDAHRKWDSINRRGHPVCKFCRETFYEFENLITHIREKHFLCDICYSSRIFEVFKHQKELFLHYKMAHFVCPECEPNGTMSCFPTEERLSAHRSLNHTEEAKNDPNMWQPVQIRYTNRGLISQYTRSGGRREQNGATDEVPEVYYPAVQQGPNPEEWTGADFPSLTFTSSGATPTTNTITPTAITKENHRPQRAVRSHAAVVRGSTRALLLSNNQEDFPSLPSAPASSNATTEIRTNSNWGATKKPSGATTSSVAHRNTPQIVPTLSDFPSLPSASTATVSNTKWSALPPKVSPHTDSKPETLPTKRQPTAADFPALGASSTSAILQPPRLEPFALSQPTPSKRKAKKTKLKPPEPELAPDLQPFSSVLLKAKKSSWWDAADNDGAASRPLNNESGSRSTSSHNLIHEVDRLESKDGGDITISKVTIRPPDFSDLNFPSLTENSGKSGNNKVKDGRIADKSGKQPQAKSDAKKTNASGKSTAMAKQQKPSSEKTKMENFPELEDTETYIFQSKPYTMPLDFEAKNKAVIETAKEILGGTGHSKNAFTQCTRLCQRYSTGALSAKSYLQGLSSIFSPTSNPDEPEWFSRMIALLPSIGLQRALFRALKGEAAPKVPFANTPARCRGNTPPVWAKNVISRLQVCSKCEQVCLRSDMREHMSLAHS